MITLTEREQKILDWSNHWPNVKQRLSEARSVLTRESAPLFRPGVFDQANKRLLSNCGTIALQWKLRRKPDQPVSYENQQCSQGIVSIVYIDPVS